jgi:Rieske Fe-S protein
MTISRRRFIKLTGTTAFCTCLASAVAVSGCSMPVSNTPPAPEGSYRKEGDRIVVSLSKIDGLKKVGGAVKFTVHDEDGSELKAIVVHSEDEEYRAFADRCTHNGKELNYLHQEGRLACCGLGSQFDLEGSVLEGPAEDALAAYPVRWEGEDLVIDI